MKKRRGNGNKKPKIFNSLNIILIALLFVELLFIANLVPTGQPVKSADLEKGKHRKL